MRNQPPNRYFERRSLVAVGRIDDGLPELAQDLLRRIRHIRLKTQAGTYILSDSDRYVYVLREQATSAQDWVRRCPGMVVGLYAASAPVYPDAEQLRSDLIAFIERLQIPA